MVGGRELAQAFSPYVRRADVHDSLTNNLLHPVFCRRMDRRGEGGEVGGGPGPPSKRGLSEEACTQKELMRGVYELDNGCGRPMMRGVIITLC